MKNMAIPQLSGERWIQQNYKVFGYFIKSSRRRDGLGQVDVRMTATPSCYPVGNVGLETGGETHVGLSIISREEVEE